jgi:hypothetical protein
MIAASAGADSAAESSGFKIVPFAKPSGVRDKDGILGFAGDSGVGFEEELKFGDSEVAAAGSIGNINSGDDDRRLPGLGDRELLTVGPELLILTCPPCSV